MNAIQQIPEGVALIPFLERIAKDLTGDGWFRGHGQVQDVVLTDATGKTVATLDGSSTLVGLDASVVGGKLQVTATVLAPFGGGATTVSGFVREATVLNVRLVSVTMGGATPQLSQPPKATVVQRATPSPVKAQPKSTPTAPKSPWDAVADVSDEVEEEDSFEVEELERGDILVHPKLGRCRVWAVLGNDAVSVTLPTGKTRKLKLSMFKITQLGETREFRLEILRA